MIEKFSKAAKCKLIIGTRGTGKSTRAKALILKTNRVIVFDPLDEYSINPLYIRIDTLKALKRELRKRWDNKKGFYITYVPRGDEKFLLHELSVFLMAVQEPYRLYNDNRELLLIVEEMDLSYPSSKIKEELYGFKDVILRGRHYGINVLGITQRPAQISTIFSGNCQEIYVFGLANHNDFKGVRFVIGNYDKEIRALKPHDYLKWEQGGKVSLGRNILNQNRKMPLKAQKNSSQKRKTVRKKTRK